MPTVPTLELTFRNVAGDPWEGEAVARYQGNCGEPFPVREGLTTKQRNDLRWYVENFLDFPEGGYLTRARRIEREMDEYGRELWEGLKKGETVTTWLGAVQAARKGRLELRVETREDEVAFRSPWELLRADDRLLHQHRVTVVRRPLSRTPQLHPADTSKGLRVLVVVCRPDEADFLDPRYTPQAILEALAARPEVSVDFCRPGTLQALRVGLQAADDRGEPYHVLHFDGHGTTLASQGGIGALCFENNQGGLDPVKARRFGDLMSEFDIPLVVLEACRTSTPSFAQETVASELLRRGVGTVVAMGHAVFVEMTEILMRGFYGALTQSVPIGEALRRARNDVYTTPARHLGTGSEALPVDLQDWFVPQLYQGGEDPVLLESEPQVTHAPADPAFRGFPPPPRAGFEGRGRELHRLERNLLRHPVVVLHGPGGLGKTALAREAAHWWTKTGWFEAAFFVSFEGRPSPEKVVNDIGFALERTDFYKQSQPAEWVADQLAKRRLLLVWDNFESVLPAFQNGEPTPPELAELAERWTAAGSRILVTSRSPEVPLPNAQPVGLWTLSDPEALGLLARLLDKLGKGRAERAELGWDADTLQPLIDATGGHPLALELVAPYLEQLGPEEVVADLGPLLAKAKQDHGEGRNRSLWASLEFSIQHLSEEAREALPAVALMAGGCMEVMAQMTAGLDKEAWGRVRRVLERSGMIRVTGPVLRPHPVLAEVEALAPSPEVEERFFGVVRQLCGEFDQLVRSNDPKPALATMAVNEIVAHRAVNRALDAGRVEVTCFVATSLKWFLERTGRAGEGARLMGELGRRAGGSEDSELTELKAVLVREAAWARAPQDPAGAVAALEGLLSTLKAVKGWDSRDEQAFALGTLGRVHYNFLGHPTSALEPLKEAARLFAKLEKEGTYDSANGSAVLGDLANALRELGRHDEALVAAEEALALGHKRGDTYGVALSLLQTAHTLMDAGRLGEAEERYGKALEAARKAGDHDLLSILYQQLGVVARRRGRYDEAEANYRRALVAFERAGNTQGRMQALNLLGTVEHKRGNLREAQTWYERSRALAEELRDLPGQATTRANVSLLYLQRAEQTDDPKEAQRWLHRAIAEGREVLEIEETLDQPASIAISNANLAAGLRRAGQLDQAEKHAREALALWERVPNAEAWKTLGILEDIAEDRGDKSVAAEWRRRKEEAHAEAHKRAGVGGLGLQKVTHLLQLAHAARAQGVPLGEVLAQSAAPQSLLDQIRERDPWLLTHLQALAGGEGRPEAKVPALYTEVVDAAWAAVG